MKKKVIIIGSVCLALLIGIIIYKLFFDYDSYGGDYCPKCKSTNVAKIVYGIGTPSNDPDKIPRGCVVNSDSKKYKCKDCKLEWGNAR